MILKFFRKFFYVLKEASKAFSADNAVKLSAALSYYTIFAIGPLLVIVLSLSGIFLGEAAVEGKLYGQMRGLIGSDAALQVQEIIKNIQKTNNSTIGAIIGGVVLVIGATGIFAEIQDSINYIWSLKAKPKRGIIKFLFNRLLSFSLIISLGFLLIVSLVANALMDILNERLTRYFPDTMVYIIYGTNLLMILGVISLLFAIIFKVLPDGKIKWKDAFVGAFFTSILFLIGKSAIGYYLGNSKLGSTFGTAASVVIILTWVYYTSIILYFGAEFTKVYALEFGGGIVPNETAVFIIKQEAKELEISPRRLRKMERAANANKNAAT
ncbi:MAG: YihY/virulence factor BrkB family protein [Ferruginibacter sp.]|nr:YihY/virulence factor BrkB family protein [Ferruginibacter sp.]